LYYPISLFKAFQHADPLIRLTLPMTLTDRLIVRAETVIIN